MHAAGIYAAFVVLSVAGMFYSSKQESKFVGEAKREETLSLKPPGRSLAGGYGTEPAPAVTMM